MALFTDAPISTLDQLAAQDTAVLDVTSTEGIDAAAKISLAQDELGIELVAAFSRSPLSMSTPSTWWPGMAQVGSATLRLSNIVVSPPLRLWHTFRTLELIYRDAYNNQLNDRYLGKWNAYRDLAKWASGVLFQTGVGVVSDPVGIAQSPQLGVLNGSLPAATYFVQVAWMNARGEEGMASNVTSASAPDQNSVRLKPVNPPGNVQSWNAYVGTSIDSIMLQNATPLNLDQLWVIAPSGLSSGKSPGVGQEPNYYRQLPRYLQRG